MYRSQSHQPTIHAFELKQANASFQTKLIIGIIGIIDGRRVRFASYFQLVASVGTVCYKNCSSHQWQTSQH